MPFMKARGALRRTLQYLEKGEIILKDNVSVLAFQCNTVEKARKWEDAAEQPAYLHHEGLSNFIFWHLPQLKYKNPGVQMVTFDKLTPTPWICAYLDDNHKVYIDCDSRSREDIHEHVKLVLGKSRETLQLESREETAILQNPANFGYGHERECICEIPGQVPCTGFERLPTLMTGKGRRKAMEDALDD